MRLFKLKTLGLVFALSLSPALSACAQQTVDKAEVASGALEEVQVKTADATHAFKVEIADDELERQKGLMYRENLTVDRGMLFLFPDVRERSFWMRNTLISLDIIYLSAQGEVVSIQKQAVPLDDTPLPSYGPAVAVLEIQGGLADRLGIRPGDKVSHRFFEGKGPKPY